MGFVSLIKGLNSLASTTILTFRWWIRASWLIWGSTVHRINRITRINHDLFSVEQATDGLGRLVLHLA